jgi:FdhD protein
MTDEGETRRVARVAWQGEQARHDDDEVAGEAPLEIRVAGQPLAVLMRTPGHDDELARGFLLTEGVVARPADVVSVRHCSDAPDDDVVNVVLAEGVDVDWARLRRSTFASSSCGVCGKRTRAAALGVAPPLVDAVEVAVETLYELPGRLRAAQAAFGLTGGLHAAGLYDAAGAALVVREDVGRHNAVDKVVGWAAAAGEALAGRVLVVSGRVSFEIVQKALAARIPVVAAVSAPTSLAVEVARERGLTLVAFLRDRRLNVYAGGERIRGG